MSQEGEYHDFISEHHVLWEAGSKENWEKVCEVVDSQIAAHGLQTPGRAQLPEPGIGVGQ